MISLPLMTSLPLATGPNSSRVTSGQYDSPFCVDEIKIIMRLSWVAVYNANLDRSPALRKRPAELRLEMRRWAEDKRASKKEPLKTDITEYRVRTPLLSLCGLRHNQATIVACKQSRV